jgi:hypothetical protein
MFRLDALLIAGWTVLCPAFHSRIVDKSLSRRHAFLPSR